MKSLRLMGKKLGMTQIFDEEGNLVVCTAISVEPNVVVQIKNMENDGYNAIQLGAGKLSSSRKKNLAKPYITRFDKANIEPKESLLESRLDDSSEYKVGQEISVDYFSGTSFVDVCGISKGKGFQGVIKRHKFAGGPAAHGSGFHRHAGSTGMRTTPGRTLPNHPMPGHMGCDKVTVENLKVVKIDADKQVILVKGAIPGARNAPVYVRKSMKKSK
ncbi:MAG: 50S ribosomal protein L3 [Chlamydiales bacterium]|nr:50S ribosomal protein L3 [Chlamydiales bacterium]